jgi:pimeloyl-ACP methyl ester carboxylesterase
MNDRDVRAADGRTLRVREAGDPSGVAVIDLHGTPGSRLVWPGVVEAATERGVRLISYDRPGYGGSTRLEGRNIADCAADVRAIAQALGVTRLAVMGSSGGGPHSAACASLLSGLVAAAAVLCSGAPYGAPGLDYFAGMGAYNVEDTKLYFDDPRAAHAKAVADRQELLAADPAAGMELLRSLLSPVDQAMLTPEFAAFLHEDMTTALAPSVDGWWDDSVADLGDWGFGLSQISVPVLVMHGRQDRFVPVAHGEWLAGVIPGAEARIYDDEGHLSLMRRSGEVLDWLLERLG